ncbi:hypothetical protein DFS34DRAFT_625688 [Phlyctochytrium arcticum]|nr:hypothetical protein DFS34DRAFT_625688 [Phlyctochytrium arcticum]
MGNSAIGPIAKSLSCTYRAQVTYPDTITIGMSIRPEHVLKDRFTQTCIMVSHKQERLVAESECLVVTFDYRTQKKAPIPEAILAAWKLGEGIEE